MRDLRSRPPDPRADPEAFQAFLETCEAQIALHPLWRGASASELESAGEALEKYLASKLHDRLPLPLEDSDRDAAISARMTALAGLLKPEHLEVPARVVAAAASENGEGGFEKAMDEAAAQLRRIDAFKAPRDKLICVLNAAAAINGLLQQVAAPANNSNSNNANANAKAADGGADAFQPLLVLALVRSRAARLASNVSFIERYRGRARLTRGAAAYYFVALASAASFVESVDAGSLSGCGADEFLAHMLAAGAVTEEQLAAMAAAAERREGGKEGGEEAGVVVATKARAAPPRPPPPPPPPPRRSSRRPPNQGTSSW
jgi:hypothetical protein